MNRKARTVAIIAGLIAVTVLSAGFLSWDRVLSRYHGWRLRLEPEHLHKIVFSPEASPEGLAVREFVRTEPGKKALLEFYLKLFPEYLEERLERYEERRNEDPLLLWLYHPTQYQHVEHYCRSIGAGVMSVNAKIRELQPLLWSVGYRDYPLPGREFLKLSCFPWVDYERVTGLPLGFEEPFGSGFFAIEWAAESSRPLKPRCSEALSRPTQAAPGAARFN